MAGIELDQVAAQARPDRAHRLRQCLRAAGRGEPEQHIADTRLPFGEQSVAAVFGDTLAVLEHAQLAGQVDQVIRVGADPKAPAVVAVGGERKETVCEVRLGQGQRPATAPL